jgi:uncharacterized DUF497 family protein
MLFEWDKTKAERYEQKHLVSFAEATSVFDDPLSELFDDPEHSEQEGRLLLIGHSEEGRMLIVSFTERLDATRIISARVVTKDERKNYEA